MDQDANAVRPGEQLEWPRLVAWLRERLPACEVPGLNADAEPAVAQFPGGHSNLTYLVRFGDADVVVRRPPFGPVPPTAHDMAREFRWLAAMHRVFPLAPRPYLLCEDLDVIGSVFYAMERRRGLVVRAEEPAALADPPARRRLSEAMIDTLADLHAIDVSAPGLSTLGKPAGFVERQVRGWSERWKRSQTSEQPAMDQLAAWLVVRLPPDASRPTLLHGDFKLDNVMLDALDVGRLVAVFDWEMSAVGDPLVDLGILLAYWIHTVPVSQRDALTSVTRRAGWFTREEMLERYAARTGNDLTKIEFYEVFAVFKLAVVLQQIFYRYHRGQTDDARFARLDERVTWLERIATALAERV